MYTFLFTATTIVAFITLLLNQPIDRRTIFEPNVLILGLFSLCYLVPTLAIVFGTGILQMINQESVELLSQYGFLFVLSFLFFNKLLERFPRRLFFSARKLNLYWSPKQCFIVFCLFFSAIKIILNYYGVNDSDVYSEQYIVRASIPTIIAQGINILQSVKWISLCLLLVSSFNYSATKYSLHYIVILFFVLLVDMWFTNSRSEFVTFSILFIATYTLYNRPIGLKKEIGFAVIFILMLGIFALKRVTSDGTTSLNLVSIVIPSEFIFIYRNAHHLASISNTTEFVQSPGSSYLQALISFIPMQLNEGKWDPATWYVKEYFSDYLDAGGGLAFGIIPEAIINWGLASIVFQSAILVIIFRIANTYAYRSQFIGSNFWVIFYLFCISQIYNVIRYQSFSIISGSFFGFVVPFFLLLLISRVRL
jgi:oligosaccharide repeat unit polymerase